VRLEGTDAGDPRPCSLGGIRSAVRRWRRNPEKRYLSFGQALVPEVIDRAMQAAAEADLFISVGTSLHVYPIARGGTARRTPARVW